MASNGTQRKSQCFYHMTAGQHTQLAKFNDQYNDANINELNQQRLDTETDLIWQVPVYVR